LKKRQPLSQKVAKGAPDMGLNERYINSGVVFIGIILAKH
jgi:hypothetical protein